MHTFLTDFSLQVPKENYKNFKKKVTFWSSVSRARLDLDFPPLPGSLSLDEDRLLLLLPPPLASSLSLSLLLFFFMMTNFVVLFLLLEASTPMSLNPFTKVNFARNREVIAGLLLL
jgi:hypothetical protein